MTETALGYMWQANQRDAARFRGALGSIVAGLTMLASIAGKEAVQDLAREALDTAANIKAAHKRALDDLGQADLVELDVATFAEAMAALL